MRTDYLDKARRANVGSALKLVDTGNGLEYDCMYHLDSRIGRSEFIFSAYYGAPPVSGANEIDRVNRKSLHYQDLSKERP